MSFSFITLKYPLQWMLMSKLLKDELDKWWNNEACLESETGIKVQVKTTSNQ